MPFRAISGSMWTLFGHQISVYIIKKFFGTIPLKNEAPSTPHFGISGNVVPRIDRAEGNVIK
jgi:hypothetical protein